MRVFCSFLILLISCTEKQQQNNAVLSIVLDERFVGEWRKQLSCDGSIVCYACPEISFRADGFVMSHGKTFGDTKWSITNNQLLITNYGNEPLIENGEYSISFKDEGNEVELVNSKNGDCHLLYRIQ